jgi:hypothetical protein
MQILHFLLLVALCLVLFKPFALEIAPEKEHQPVFSVLPSVENRRGKAGNGNKEEVNRIFILNCLQFALPLQ